MWNQRQGNNQPETLEQAAQRLTREVQRVKQAEAAEEARIEGIKAKETARVVVEHKAEADRKHAEFEAGRKAVQETVEASMKESARTLYPGTDKSFNEDWPSIRARLMADEAARQDQELKASMRSMYREF